MSDPVAEAVFAREEVAKYLAGSHGVQGEEARARVEGYLDELRTTRGSRETGATHGHARSLPGAFRPC